MKLSSISVALGLALAASASGLAAAAEGPCATPLSGAGKEIALSAPLSEATRIAFSTMVYDALKAPAAGHRPEALIEDAPPCRLGSFTAGASELSYSGGTTPFPLRWATTADRELVFYLVAGVANPNAKAFSALSRPYLLVGTSDRLRLVLKVYDDAPSDVTLKADIVESLKDPDYTPLAAYDSEGDATTVFRNTKSGLGAQLFGPPPSGNRTVTIFAPDGRYFAPGRSGEAVMREADLACPDTLGKLSERRLVVVDGTAEGLDLACQYRDDDVFISIFVERLPKADLSRTFEARKAGMMQDYRNARETPQLVGVGGPTKFDYGASWLGDDDLAGGIWVGRKGDFVIEVDAMWNLDLYKDARDAIRRVDSLFFP